MVAIIAKLRELAPYAAMLILPGGSLMAILLWLYRRQKNASFTLIQPRQYSWRKELRSVR
jgi:hypothetical protein